MDDSRTSLDLLAHFDRPKSFEKRSKPSLLATAPHAEARGIRWVMKWAFAPAILMVAAGVLTRFAYMVAAEHELNIAARAAVSEAMLPRATIGSVRAAVQRRLSNRYLGHHLQFTILQNGRPAEQHIRPSEGDRFEVSISLLSSDIIPSWLKILNPTRGESSVIAYAEREVPGRKLTSRRIRQTAAE